MSQNDFVIANQSAPDFRSDLNNALQALASLSSGATAPATTYSNMLWYDTANNILKMRSEADDAWISIGYLDQSTNAFRILDDTQVVNTSGTQTGLIGDQATATWEAGTSTTESLVSPAKVKAGAVSTIDSEFNVSGSAPKYACRAWVNFNGTGTVAIRASGNVSSITDNGVGNYTINFTTAMQDANYAVASIGRTDSIVPALFNESSPPTSSSVSIRFRTPAGTSADVTYGHLVVFR